MSSLSPDVEPQRLSPTAHIFQDDFNARLKALELQLTLEHQRQRDQVEEELHKLRQQLATTVHEQQRQQQTMLATLRETVEELTKQIAEALHRLSQDVDRVAQHAEAQTSRAIERLRNELLDTLLERDHTTVNRHLLGELFITSGEACAGSQSGRRVMTAERWSVDQLGALADEWAAERGAFLTALHTYLATQLSQGVPTQLHPVDPAVYHAELAAIGERLSSFLHTLDTTPWYTMQHRMAEYLATLEAQHGAAARADAARLAALQPPSDAMAPHDAVRQSLAIVQYILRIYQELQGQFDLRHQTAGQPSGLADEISPLPCASASASFDALLAAG